MLLYGRMSYRHVGPGPDDFEGVDASDEIAEHHVGEIITIFASAPGTGRWSYQVLAINAMGVWVRELSCTVRELQPWEVI